MMRPKQPRDSGQHELLRSRLDQIIDTGHALAKLARTIYWDFLSQKLGVTDKIKSELRRRCAIGYNFRLRIALFWAFIQTDIQANAKTQFA